MSDKTYEDLDSFDAILLDILRLDQLKVDMEAILDDLIVQYRKYCEEDREEIIPVNNSSEGTSSEKVHHEEEGLQSFERMFARKSSIFAYSVDPSTSSGLASRHASVSNMDALRATVHPEASRATPPPPGTGTGTLSPSSDILLDATKKVLHASNGKGFSSSPLTGANTAAKSPSPATLPPPARVTSPPLPAVEDFPDSLEGRYVIGEVMEAASNGLPFSITLKRGVSKVTKQQVLLKVGAVVVQATHSWK